MIGSIVGNYKIIDKIGEGGMGSVFKGVDLMLEREVAIKMLRPELAQQPNVVERFRTEAVTLAKLNHPNVATLHSFFRQGEDFFMVMEFVRGETLDHMIRTRGAMPCDQAIQLMGMALEGMDHAHKMGIVHRDIKPANMMLTDSGSIKVMDFGIARVLGTDRLTKVGHLIGTVEYMSPEQVRGEETDARSDIYSLGILLYEMLTGRVPFTSTSEYELMRCQIEDAPTPPRTFAPHIPLPVEQAIMRSLAKKREARYQSASEFRMMLLQTTGSLARPSKDSAIPAGGDAAPATFADQALRTAPASGDVLKATRLGDPNMIPAAGSGLLRETRLAPPNAALPQAAPVYYQQPAGQAGPTGPSLFSKLNWKHFAGAGAALIVLVGLTTFALVGVGSKTVAPPTPANVEPPAANPNASAPVEPPPASNLQTAPVQPVSPTGASNQPPASGSNSGGDRSRDSRAQKTAEVPPATVSTAQPPAQQEPPRAEPAPVPKQEHATVTRPVEKKEPIKSEAKKDDKKVGEKIGGFFKKVFGGDKKKDDKKP